MPNRKRQRITVDLLDESPAAAAAPCASAAAEPAAVLVRHEGVFCDGCADSESDAPVIVGVRWTRLDKDFDLCAACYAMLGTKQQRRYEALTTAVAAAPPEDSADDDSGSEEDGEGEEGEDCGSGCSHGEMAVPHAQRTSAVRVKNVLSANEIKKLLSAHSHLQESCGHFKKTGKGNWSTTFLHTDGQFGAALPQLRQKIMDLAATVDAEQGWNREFLHIPDLNHHLSIQTHHL